MEDAMDINNVDEKLTPTQEVEKKLATLEEKFRTHKYLTNWGKRRDLAKILRLKYIVKSKLLERQEALEEEREGLDDKLTEEGVVLEEGYEGELNGEYEALVAQAKANRNANKRKVESEHGIKIEALEAQIRNLGIDIAAIASEIDIATIMKDENADVDIDKLSSEYNDKVAKKKILLRDLKKMRNDRTSARSEVTEKYEEELEQAEKTIEQKRRNFKKKEAERQDAAWKELEEREDALERESDENLENIDAKMKELKKVDGFHPIQAVMNFGAGIFSKIKNFVNTRIENSRSKREKQAELSGAKMDEIVGEFEEEYAQIEDKLAHIRVDANSIDHSAAIDSAENAEHSIEERDGEEK